MTDPVLSQLMAVESSLTEQIDQLDTQLTQLQIKRQELLSVIEMFNNDALGNDANGKATSVEELSSRDIDNQRERGERSASEKQMPSAAETSAAAETKLTKTKSTAGAELGRKPGQTNGSKRKKKKDGRAAVWQKYVQSQYKNLALPEAVSSVLRSQPSEVFKIVDVMSSIFKESMPKMYYLKARNRISNILSAGARDGTWYRGSNGRYSQSESVTQK